LIWVTAEEVAFVTIIIVLLSYLDKLESIEAIKGQQTNLDT